PFDNISSSPDAIALRSANIALKDLITNRNKPLDTPARKYVSKLANTAEQFQAQNALLKRELSDVKRVVSARAERKSGKRVAIEGRYLISTQEVYEQVADA